MIASLDLLLVLAAPFQPAPPPHAPVPPVCLGAPAVQDEEVQDDRADVAERIETLEAHGKQRGEEDEQAIAVIDTLAADWGGLGPNDRERVVEALEDLFKLKRPIEVEPGVPDDRLFVAAAVALGHMGPESVDPLLSVLRSRTHRKNLRLQVLVAASLGRTGHPDAVDPLLDLLKEDEAELVAAGASALGGFRGAEQKVRKEIVEHLVRVLIDQKTETDDSPEDVEAQERWGRISGPIVSTLTALTGHEERAAEAWQRWWNDHKKEDWDA